jgi:hypothetical protein
MLIARAPGVICCLRVMHSLLNLLTGHGPKIVKHTHKLGQMTARPWFRAGTIQKHTLNLITKKATKGFKFPKLG